ncbi:MAG: leucine-rich repeat domain-containing protein, partial [Saprospiraceae bacterium]
MEDKPKEILELERALGIGSVSIYNIEYGKLVSLAIFGENLQDITPISALKQLTSLDLTYNKISDISPLKKLKRLTHLDLTNNKISDISPLRTLHALNLLHASGNQISDLSPLQALNDLTLLDLAKNKITDLSHLNKLIGLKRLHLSRNKISDLTPLKKLTHLTSLYLSNNQISIVLPLQELFNLTTLDLSNNHISDIYPLIEIIKKGLKLSLKENDYTNNSIRLNGNPVSIPPLEIVEKGNKAVLDYFDDLEKYGEFEILEGKLLIVGEPKAGKTTLRKKIFDPEYPVPCKEEKETIGVQILKGWEFPYLEDQAKIFTANIWDFGGQERQYPLHQFFMDDVSCYVLVSDDRADNSNMDKWFGMIKLLGGTHSNVLVILNQINRSTPSSNFNKERYEKQGFTIETFPIDFSGNIEVINILLENIKNRISNLEHIG